MCDKVPPNASNVFQPKSTWSRALTAFLGSRHVQLRNPALMVCNSLGLEQLPPMWHAAQALRRRQPPSSGGIVSPFPVRSPEEAERKRNLQRALEGLYPPIEELEMVEGRQYDVCDVAEVLSASFGYTSITARPQDVTQHVRRRLKDGQLRSSAAKGGAADEVRRFATRNTRKLTLQYRSSRILPPEDLLPRISAVLERLRESGWSENLHGNDGEQLGTTGFPLEIMLFSQVLEHSSTLKVCQFLASGFTRLVPVRYTWYKLNEWMQVEILQIFGQSLESEPWYRFPYFQFMKVYFDVLFQESSIVQRKLGLKKAFGSMAFITSLVPGLIMTLLFAQMKVLATPLLAMPGLGFGCFGESYDEAQTREELVILRPKDAPPVDWRQVDERITDITCPVQGLFTMKVPTFKVPDGQAIQ
eukprot:Skav234575  [mRNA]  locus=scaffold2869:193438:197603:+ [translate_table: standard]